MEIKILNDKLHEESYFPTYATAGSAGIDLRACIDEKEIKVYPGQTKLIPTGIALNISDPSIASVLWPRSGLGHKHGIVLGNLTGLIDSDYQGEVFISCWNRNNEGKEFTIEQYDRIAQMVFLPIIKPHFKVVEEFSEVTLRGDGGFNSTGTK